MIAKKKAPGRRAILEPLSRPPRAGVRALRVIDGDTFDHAGERIRIADIDTPELRSSCAQEGRLARTWTGRREPWC